MGEKLSSLNPDREDQRIFPIWIFFVYHIQMPQPDLHHQIQVLTERVSELESLVLTERPAKQTLRGELRELIVAPSRTYIGTAILGIVLTLAAITVSLTFTNEQLARLERTAAIIERFLDHRAR